MKSITFKANSEIEGYYSYLADELIKRIENEMDELHPEIPFQKEKFDQCYSLMVAFRTTTLVNFEILKKVLSNHIMIRKSWSSDSCTNEYEHGVKYSIDHDLRLKKTIKIKIADI